MDLTTVTEIVHAETRAELPSWIPGDGWLAGGTWLFSEPQPHLRRLIDLTSFRWPALTVTQTDLEIAATCTVAQLDAFGCPANWLASPLIGQCCRAFLASFKVWKTATVGGNLCLSLPAGPMISLTAALDGICTIWKAGGGEQQVSVLDFVIGNQCNVLAPGDILRGIRLPLSALRRRAAFRQIALTPVGRSSALVVGTLAEDGGFALTITAATIRPFRLAFVGIPSADALRDELRRIPEGAYHNDVHGKPEWRQHMTLRLSEEIRREFEDFGR